MLRIPPFQAVSTGRAGSLAEAASAAHAMARADVVDARP